MTQYPTAEMIEAGVDAAEKQFWECVSEHDVRAIFLAMRAKEQSLSPNGVSQSAVERYGGGALKFACPGDEQNCPPWILRFSDHDIREAVFIGDDAEQQAWEAWNRYAPAYNCYLFQCAALATQPSIEMPELDWRKATQAASDMGLREALEQPDFVYFECQDCGFSSVQPADFDGSEYCPLCEGDNGRSNRMSKRTALSTDKPEGKDARTILETTPDDGASK